MSKLQGILPAYQFWISKFNQEYLKLVRYYSGSGKNYIANSFFKFKISTCDFYI